ncbi:LysR family transcriptional regulator [Nocardia sp. alder85J]|uniref:LysR family transcriptional regulator n=1 Tax=Nocardia sp. alder85J TaxID=2862949 RepID=UPI001CD7DD65|nr:LysR family transcriptional regulator [Nocardia sp. alder85J]MCX4091239.1 LysR family transcriptional regulator [Nocardia sp. alder85J]
MTPERPDLAVLALLVAIDDHGSLGAAARTVGMAQPNASRAVRAWEQRLGLPLVERGPRGSTMSAAGRVVVHWARQVLADVDRLLDAAAALRTDQEAELTVFASMTVAECLLPGWLGEFRRHHPDVRIHLQMRNSREVFERLATGECDLGFVESPTVPARLHSATVAGDRLVVIVDPAHPWARRRRALTVAELAATPLVVREPGSGTRGTLDVALAEYPRAEPLLELGSAAAIRTSVLAGVGPAVVSSLAVGDQLARGELCAIAVEGLELPRTLRAVWRPPRRLSGPAGELVAEIVRARRSGDRPR